MYSTSANVTISDVASGTYNGIEHTELNGNHNIAAFTHDTYTIDVGTNATSTGYAGGTGAKATENRHIDVMFPVVQNLQVPGTSKSTTYENHYKGCPGQYCIFIHHYLFGLLGVSL